MGLREIWDDGGTAFGAWIMLSGPAGAEMVATMGFDYVGIDCQHGLIGYEQMRDIILTLNGVDTAVVVRVPWNDPSSIGKALDCGAEGIIVPMVNSAADAASAAHSAHFPPDGGRSYGLARGHLPLGRNTDEINRRVVCLAMIETQEAVDVADAICSTPGIDGIYIGPGDLALSMGEPPIGDRSDEHGANIERIREACDKAGIVPAIHAMNGAEAKERAGAGFRMVTVTADAAVLAIGSLTELGAARS